MAEDHADIYDFSTMTDDEIYDVVLERLREYPEVDAEGLEVEVRDGRVTLGGRVSSDREARVAETVLTEVLGLNDVVNDLVVDPLRRGENPAAADDAVTADMEVEDSLGEEDPNQSDTAQHLTEDLDAAHYGTHDMQQAVEDGVTYEPPDRPVSDGYESRERH